MRLLNRHLPTLLFVLILALGTTGAFALGAHDEAATDGLDTAETAQAQNSENGEASENAEDNHGATVSEFVETTATTFDEGCERGLAIADLASSYGNDGDSRVAEQAHENCEDDNDGVESLENGDDANGFGQETAENAQELDEGESEGENFGRTTADEARGDAGDQPEDAGSQQNDARDRGDDAQGDAGR